MVVVVITVANMVHGGGYMDGRIVDDDGDGVSGNHGNGSGGGDCDNDADYAYDDYVEVGVMETVLIAMVGW